MNGVLSTMGLNPMASLDSGLQVLAPVSISWQAALLVALFYYLSQSAWMAGLGFWTLYRPLVGGLVVGAILGDIPGGVRAGAVINLAYLGFVATGGTLPTDISLAGYVGTVLVLRTRVEPGAALALMLPVGVLGFFVYQLRMTLDVVFAHWADRYAARGDVRGLAICNVALPQALLLLISLPPCFIGVFYGPIWLERLLGSMPAWLLPGLGVVGSMFLAFGIAMNLRLVWRPITAAYFVVCFVLATVVELPILAWAILGVSIAAIHLHLSPGVRTGETGETEQNGASGDRITEVDPTAVPSVCECSLRKRDLLRVCLNWLFFSHACYNYERMQGIGFAHALAPALKRIYPEREQLGEALKRHTVYYNSEPNIGVLVHGVVLALEEARARGHQVTESAIQATKAGLMAPLSGVGDTLIQGALAPVLLSVGISLAQDGSALGPVLYVAAIAAIIWTVNWQMLLVGYRQGRSRAVSLLQQGAWQQFLIGAEVVGSIILAVLAVEFVRVTTPWSLAVGQVTFRLQEDLLDRLMPHLLPFLLVLAYVFLLRKRISPEWIVGGTFLFGLAAHLCGLL